MLDTQAFYEDAQPFASKAGLQKAAKLVQDAEQAAKDTQAGVDAAQARIVALMAQRTAFQELQASVKHALENEDRENLDSFISAGTLAEYQPVALTRQARRAELDLLIAASARLSQTLIPAAAIDKLRQEVSKQGSIVILAESQARLLIARKLVLLTPLIAAEGEGITCTGGAADSSISNVTSAREKYAILSNTLETAEGLFKDSQEKLPQF